MLVKRRQALGRQRSQGLMSSFSTITDLSTQAELLHRRSHGVIEVAGGRLVGVRLRPWPRIVSLAEARIGGALYHRLWRGDRCRLYFNQTRAFPNYLILKYTVTASGTSWKTFFRALDALDRIAAIKGSDAILCEASNQRISDRLLARMGWEPHCPGSRRRHFIKRFGPSLQRDRIDDSIALLAS
jgi:hypothetical protein